MQGKFPWSCRISFEKRRNASRYGATRHPGFLKKARIFSAFWKKWHGRGKRGKEGEESEAGGWGVDILNLPFSIT